MPENRPEGVRQRATKKGLTVVLIGPSIRADSEPPADIHIPVRAGQTGDAVLAGQLLAALALASTVKTLRSGVPRS